MKNLILALSLMSFGAVAEDAKINFHKEIEILVVNGEEVNGGFGHQDSVVVPKGENQLLLRIAKVIRLDGQKTKFESKTLLITFNVLNDSYKIEPPIKIKNGEQANKYNEKPSIVLTSESSTVNYRLDIVTGSGKSLFRNYEKDVQKYNNKGGIASLSSAKKLSIEDQEDLKNYFLNMDKNNQKEFLDWASEIYKK
ncbi:DUF2057 family protein [Vibrio sp. Of7-15]|uniref:YccT family protein n=1 Tax=Vibrio sp. Of7-15 TaxID=2724879 RepID=UPI001EF27177|nr:DUF2057 family protein [Vibrio sp. Of7-15]